MSKQKFAGILCYHLVTNTLAFHSSPEWEPHLLLEIGLPACTSLSATKFSDVTTSSLGSGLKEHVTRRTLKDNNGLLHHQVNFPTTVGKKHLNTSLQTMQGKTRKKASSWLLLSHCGETIFFCCSNKCNTEQDCFKEHIENTKQSSKLMQGWLWFFSGCWHLFGALTDYKKPIFLLL